MQRARSSLLRQTSQPSPQHPHVTLPNPIPPSPWACIQPHLPPQFRITEACNGLHFTLDRERYHITTSSLDHLQEHLAWHTHLMLEDYYGYASTHTHIEMSIKCLESETDATPGRGFCSVLA